MSNISSLSEIATLAGEPARAAMLVALMDGRALTAGELARVAGVTPATASGHLGMLSAGGLLTVAPQGRHRYFRISSPAVATMLEGMMSVSEVLRHNSLIPRKTIVTGPRDKALRRARVCYDHLAGEVAVGITDSLVDRGYLDLSRDGAALTRAGSNFLASIGVPAPDRVRTTRGPVQCRPCLDWSERRPHVAGVVGAALLARMLECHWLRRMDGTRAVAITPPGRAALERHFEVVSPIAASSGEAAQRLKA